MLCFTNVGGYVIHVNCRRVFHVVGVDISSLTNSRFAEKGADRSRMLTIMHSRGRVCRRRWRQNQRQRKSEASEEFHPYRSGDTHSHERKLGRFDKLVNAYSAGRFGTF